MFVEIGHTCESTVEGTAVKTCECENCHNEYVYKARRTATASAFGIFVDIPTLEIRATRKAYTVLDKKLQRILELIPCPACGWYQQNMVEKARKLQYRWLSVLGIALTTIAAFIGAVIGLFVVLSEEKIPWFVLAVFFVPPLGAGIGAIVISRTLSSNFDPNNSDVNQRLELGKLRAVLRADHEQTIRAQQHELLEDPPV